MKFFAKRSISLWYYMYTLILRSVEKTLSALCGINASLIGSLRVKKTDCIGVGEPLCAAYPTRKRNRYAF